MKILEINVTGIPLLDGPLQISFLAKQRVREEDKTILCQVASNIYVHCANAFIGINASGKTTVLKIISLALGILRNEPVNFIEGCNIMGDEKNISFEIIFFAKPGKICKLKTEISSSVNKNGDTKYFITNESLWEKDAKNLSKKELLDFSGIPMTDSRKNEAFLSNDVSFIIARNKREKEDLNVESVIALTDYNILPRAVDITMDIVSFLDPTIEYIYSKKTGNKNLVHLKFYDKKEIIVNSPEELEAYLSSGTINGIVVFSLAKNILQSGGYLIVDEIENHFNQEIVASLIRLFLDNKINKKGANLIFTTHYAELLDEYNRNDGIHVLRNKKGITVQNLCEILTRNDIKKSEAYQSGFLGGTVPAYETYMALRKNLIASIKEDVK